MIEVCPVYIQPHVLIETYLQTQILNHQLRVVVNLSILRKVSVVDRKATCKCVGEQTTLAVALGAC